MRIRLNNRFRVALLALVLLAVFAPAQAAPLVTGVDSIAITVSDMDRSVAFYSEVLTFEKVSDVEVWGSDYERLQGVFGLRMRVVRMRLGEEHIELIQYLAPRGRPIPVDSRTNDRWFQHIAIIVSAMERAYARLRQKALHPLRIRNDQDLRRLERNHEPAG